MFGAEGRGDRLMSRLRWRARRYRTVGPPARLQPGLRRARPPGSGPRKTRRRSCESAAARSGWPASSRPGSSRPPDFRSRQKRSTGRGSAAGTGARPEIYVEMVAAGRLPPRPGIRRIVAEATAAGWQLAVCSTSAEASVRAILTHALGAAMARTLPGPGRRRRGRARSQRQTSTGWRWNVSAIDTGRCGRGRGLAQRYLLRRLTPLAWPRS